MKVRNIMASSRHVTSCRGTPLPCFARHQTPRRVSSIPGGLQIQSPTLPVRCGRAGSAVGGQAASLVSTRLVVVNKHGCPARAQGP